MYSEEDGQESATSGSQLNEADGGSALGDGTDVKVHHSTRMCFPASTRSTLKPPTVACSLAHPWLRVARSSVRGAQVPNVPRAH